LSEKLKAAKAENKTLTEKLTRKDDGSLFDLKNDSVKEIAEAIAANISEAKAAALAKAIPEAIKELKRKRQKPAG
jgi:L-lactate utilization protein LutC